MKLLTLCAIYVMLISTRAQLLTIMDSSNEIHQFDIIPCRFYNDSRGEFYINPFFVNASISTDETDINGKLYLRPYHYGIDEEIRELSGSGILGIIMGTTGTSLKGRARYQLSEPRTPVEGLVVQVSNSDYKIINEFYEKGTLVWVVIEGNNDFINPYDEVMLIVGIMTQVILGVFFGGILLVCIFLFGFELRGDLKSTFTQHRIVLLICLLIANIFRFVFVLWDPYSFQGLSPWPLNSFIHLFNVPLTILSELIVSLLWFKTLKITLMKKNSFLVVMRLPFIIAVVVFSVLLITEMIITIIEPRFMESLIGIAAAVYVISLIGLAIYHLIVGIKFYTEVSRIKKEISRKKKNMVFIFKIICMSLSDFVMIIFIVLMFIPISYTTTVSNLFFLVAASGLHSCVVLTLFSWRISEAQSTTATIKTKSSHSEKQ
eukprot:TRINITY_DN1598_c0_g1_i6.p1 TRINITY_DN1598_c0_g1~~TRINITY_DN1598_c0_g1_i6.p1  ORF type:complete len:432 (+),score=56.10 TRINITY_DN1598_c0_g1_i6:300-1595(+)